MLSSLKLIIRNIRLAENVQLGRFFEAITRGVVMHVQGNQEVTL